MDITDRHIELFSLAVVAKADSDTYPREENRQAIFNREKLRQDFFDVPLTKFLESSEYAPEIRTIYGYDLSGPISPSEVFRVMNLWALHNNEARPLPYVDEFCALLLKQGEGQEGPLQLHGHNLFMVQEVRPEKGVFAAIDSAWHPQKGWSIEIAGYGDPKLSGVLEDVRVFSPHIFYPIFRY